MITTSKLIKLSGLTVLLTEFCLIACLGKGGNTPPASPFPTQEASSPATETPLPQPRLHLATSSQPYGISWSLDGQTLIYAENINSQNPKPNYQWYSYNLATQTNTPIEAPFRVDKEVWAKLEPTLSDPEAYAWFRGSVSPSHRYIIYQYIEPNYTPPPTGPFFSPGGVGIANFDGSNARKLVSLGGCSVNEAIWFDQERKAIISCIGEGGPADYYIVDIQQETLQTLSDIIAFKGLIMDLPAISPDETMVAIVDQNYTLQIVPFDRGSVQSVAPVGFTPNWSPDSERLYYLKGQQTQGWDCKTANIQVYDVKTGANKVIIESPLSLPDGRKIDIYCLGVFAMSPRENAAVFWFHELWLVQW